MAKQQQRPRIDKSRLSDITTDLEKTVSELTGQPTGKSFTLADTQPVKERKPGLTAKDRAKFTTMLKPELRAMLQAVADNRAISIADVLETILIEYFGLKK